MDPFRKCPKNVCQRRGGQGLEQGEGGAGTLGSFPSLVLKFPDSFLHFPTQKLALPATWDWGLQSPALSRQASPIFQEFPNPLAQNNRSKMKIRQIGRASCRERV